MSRPQPMQDSPERSEAERSITEYPSISRQIRAVKLAPHGCKRAKIRKLVKMRLRSMQREIRCASLRSGENRGTRSAS